jgi:hypothetical protein
MCVVGGSCSSFAPGHALHLIQARLASATPADWVDAIVVAVDPKTGDFVLQRIADGTTIELWSASDAAERLTEGTPVAFHARYDVLAVGTLRYNVLQG